MLLLSLTKTLAVRWKAGHMFRNTVLWRLCSRFRRWAGEVAAHWSVTGKPVKTFLLYLLGTAITTTTVVLAPVYQGYVLWRLCRWVRQWQAIRAGTERIVGGEPDFKIDTDKMYRDLREHAEQLNDLGAAIGSAVEERLRSERFKAELITQRLPRPQDPPHLHHQLCGPAEKGGDPESQGQGVHRGAGPEEPAAQEAHRGPGGGLQGLHGEPDGGPGKAGLHPAAGPGLGEYQEKFEKSGLTPMLTTPDHELYVEADGRHLWRVLDNLLGNCVKYAMPGTRVYLDVKSWDGAVCLAVKNVSREPLNIPAEQLMERFVRGDVSRTTEGSGLGLSIARSLTELQGGAFRLDIDGDLFKAVVTFPEYQEAAALVEPPSEQR